MSRCPQALPLSLRSMSSENWLRPMTSRVALALSLRLCQLLGVLHLVVGHLERPAELRQRLELDAVQQALGREQILRHALGLVRLPLAAEVAGLVLHPLQVLVVQDGRLALLLRLVAGRRVW